MKAELAPSMHPANLAFRFVLELAALGAMGYWGHQQTESWARWALSAVVPLVAATTWTIFAVPGDPSRGSEGLIHVPGWARLVLELGVMGFASWALTRLGQEHLAIGYGFAVAVHYAISYQRIAWLLT